MRLILQILVLVALIAFAGCKEDKVNTYEVSKEVPKSWPTTNHSRHTMGSQKGAPMANPSAGAASSNNSPTAPSSGMQELPGMAQQSAGFKTPDWQAPSDWKAQPLGSMRKGSWTIEENGKTAEVSVLAFPGSVGGLLANINRWAGQIGATPLTNQELEILKKENALSVDGSNGIFVELNGPNGKSIGGIIVTRPEGTWFFKMQGDTEVVESQAASLGRFISSVKFK
ncbi:hypothetical protein [Rubellicoccus peritrichatus]|uniref:PsbP C-terminal domain-containing protein n=1 Tax=Rubellicoccus peritrichatus TaxID=3080537 RepID=A0AAQ3LEW8_9BACT|nr:hypothetical protein [Puniceicoccus sp. CR14]WOO43462.1 hypothetical protein RZN69_10210 [Puniceicoccus sp. CR14]